MSTNPGIERAQRVDDSTRTDGTARPRFEQLAQEITASIEENVLRPGDRLPSIRESSRTRRLSITTVRSAYGLLESRGLVESRPQSGYYVRARAPARHSAIVPTAQHCNGLPGDVNCIVMATLKAIGSQGAMPFASPFPDPSLFPWRRVHQRMNEVSKRFGIWDPLHDMPPGQPDLIREIARRHLSNGLNVSPDEIIVTAGATEAIDLCLQAVSRPGGCIVVESPCYYATLQTIKRLGLCAIEVPASASEGIDLEALSRVLARQRVDGCVLMPNFQNPLGFVMSDAKKRAVVELCKRHDVPIIENGVYNELYYDRPPSTLKSFDTQGLVLHCGSFSKCLAAGVRLGWVLPGRYARKIETLKFLNKTFAPGIGQIAIAKFLRQDGWDLHLRNVRKTLQQRRDIMVSMVQRFFPAGTRCSQPQGGYLLWLELPGNVDSLALHREAMAMGVAISPGYIFSAGENFRHCLRLNYSYPWTGTVEAAFLKLARLVCRAAGSAMVSTETKAETAEIQL